MKSLFVTAVLCLLSVGVFAQKDIVFKEVKHGFGKVKLNVPATYTFAYTNNSTKPVVIEFANAECGCTKPVYSLAPIAAGKTGTIKVTYNSAALGVFKKNVDVKFAHSTQPYTLTIEGEVIDAKAKGK
jgi:hypothetical protein